MGGPGSWTLPARRENKKQKTGARKGGRAQRAARPSAKGGSKGGKAVDRSPDRVVDGKGRAGSVESVDGVMGWLHCWLGDHNPWKTDGNPHVSRSFGHKIAFKSLCFCFLFRGPRPSEAASGGPLNERSKTLRPEASPLSPVTEFHSEIRS